MESVEKAGKALNDDIEAKNKEVKAKADADDVAARGEPKATKAKPDADADEAAARAAKTEAAKTEADDNEMATESVETEAKADNGEAAIEAADRSQLRAGQPGQARETSWHTRIPVPVDAGFTKRRIQQWQGSP